MLMFQNLKTQLTGAFTGILASDSGNVVDLIQEIYDVCATDVLVALMACHVTLSVLW